MVKQSGGVEGTMHFDAVIECKPHHIFCTKDAADVKANISQFRQDGGPASEVNSWLVGETAEETSGAGA